MFLKNFKNKSIIFFNFNKEKISLPILKFNKFLNFKFCMDLKIKTAVHIFQKLKTGESKVF